MKIFKCVTILILIGYISVFIVSLFSKDGNWGCAALLLSIFALTFAIEDFISRLLRYRAINKEIKKKEITNINALDSATKTQLLREALGENQNGNMKTGIALIVSLVLFVIIQCLLGDILKTNDRMTMLSAILVVSSLLMNIFMRIDSDKILKESKEEK